MSLNKKPLKECKASTEGHLTALECGDSTGCNRMQCSLHSSTVNGKSALADSDFLKRLFASSYAESPLDNALLADIAREKERSSSLCWCLVYILQ